MQLKPVRATVLLVAGLLLLGGCSVLGLDDGDEVADVELAEEDAGPVAVGDAPVAPQVLAEASDTAEADGPDGSRFVAAMTCGDAMVLTVAVSGAPAGTYTGAVTPSAGGDIQLAVTEAGTGLGARQGSFDGADSYTITWPELGDTTVTIDGCP